MSKNFAKFVGPHHRKTVERVLIGNPQGIAKSLLKTGCTECTSNTQKFHFISHLVYAQNHLLSEETAKVKLYDKREHIMKGVRHRDLK